ncbi:AlwI family type II restriction endonuclease [Anaerotignum sp.]|jgi:YD repeat-containing protein|uniref:AlwI family type II restriction endonuclease n=1 Tax=Anaerotignum sp. TaxID=2039241 RepID=UPI001D06FC49|nr:AlwI family type II restriction endonuclease [Anaerotignum sp.]MCB6198906.1 AlwI family type II restriction endonuclease [Lacrimispora saccharolytica]MCG4782465.1 AlwI family type II restriction endonuclease [Acetatifactor sp. DFI.5.50]MCI7657910.1 AlwI family type II restriction endonuclease [Clostridia bacterium]MDY5415843.1 AlwI family type II restriction endonuclease [Anaerotignum sp.]
MARIDNKLLFFTTSPRTPAKMIPEIQLLHENFSGLSWNKSTQEQFIDKLAQSDFFEGKGSPTDKAFSARDRINRAPKALGFINLKPHIELTEAGIAFVYGKRPQEIFLRQLLKFQLPSPYHVEHQNIIGTFCIRPYLEILRLVRELEYITFDEFKIFAVQMTDYHKFNTIKESILCFRQGKEENKGQYKRFVNSVWENAILEIHSDRIAAGKTRTRETNDASLKKFIATQKSNMRDYADACFRYLRYTGLISISHRSRSISIFSDKIVEVDFILSTVSRDPVFIDDIDAYKAHLFSANSPVLYTDNRDNIVDILMRIGSFTKRELADKNLDELKDLRDKIVKQHKDAVIHEQVAEIKSYALYSEIIDTFNEIISDEYYDAPLMFEYNTWRAMTMLDGGNIKGNFNFDDAGQPLSTAAGNMPDIECDYDDFSLSVEVTLQSGQRQYESEGEPVARHYGQLKKRTGKDTYCLFIAPTINPATLAHFYGLNHLSIALYGGKSKIIPLELDQFMRLIENSYNYKTQPVPNDIRRFLDYAIKLCEKATDENHWRCGIQACVDTWLAS